MFSGFFSDPYILVYLFLMSKLGVKFLFSRTHNFNWNGLEWIFSPPLILTLTEGDYLSINSVRSPNLGPMVRHYALMYGFHTLQNMLNIFEAYRSHTLAIGHSVGSLVHCCTDSNFHWLWI